MTWVERVKQRWPQLFEGGTEHDSMMLALWPDSTTARLITLAGPVREKAEDLHVTLCYCGDLAEMTDSQIAGAILAVEHLAAEFGPIPVALTGVEQFNLGDGGRALYYAVDSDEIHHMNARAKELLTWYGAPLDTTHPTYTPHMTLAYVDAGEDWPLVAMPRIDTTFYNVTLSVAGKHADYPLLGEQRMTLLDRLKARFSGQAAREAAQQKRDLAVGMLWENVWMHFERMAAEGDITGDNWHMLQDLYVGSEGGLFALSVQGGKLYRSPIAVSDAGVSVGVPMQVTARFETHRSSNLVLRRADDGRPIFMSILGTAALNKDAEIDTRALMDTFVARFTGENEYVNVYHIGKDKSRIGQLLWVGRDENLLLGMWMPDDNPVARAVAATIEADAQGEWGTSIEYMPDNGGRLVEIAPGMEVRIFEAGTLWGASIVKAQHAASWSTGHLPVGRKERKMNEATRKAVEALIADTDAQKLFEQWIDGENRALQAAGAVTRATNCTCGNERCSCMNADDDPMTQALKAISDLNEKVTALTAKMQTYEGATPVSATLEAAEIELNEQVAAEVTKVFVASPEFTQVADGLARLSGAIEALTTAQAANHSAVTERLAKLEEDANKRLAALETDEVERLAQHDETKPRGAAVQVGWRASRGKEEKAVQPATMRLADIAAKTARGWEDKPQ